MAALGPQSLTYVITGASSGLGLEFVTQLLTSGNVKVVATVRNQEKAAALAELAEKHGSNLLIVTLDADIEDSVKAAAQSVTDAIPGGVDVLINNAGTLDSYLPALDTPVELYRQVLTTNVLGPFMVTKYFLPLLRKGQKKTVVNISSDAGSIAVNNKTVRPPTNGGGALIAGDYGTERVNGCFIGYNVSKAALNMQTSVIANQLNSEGFTVISLQPGWITTKLGNQWAEELNDGSAPDSDAPTTCAEVLSLIAKLKPEENNGQFLNSKGEVFPW